jgi:FkbM family methyltransferase
VWTEINQRFKSKLPFLHARLKKWARPWRNAHVPLFPVWKRLGGELFRVHPRLLTMETRDFEPHISRWILEHLDRGGTFIDVGAHIGSLSLKAARRVGRTGRVVSFEPAPVLFEILDYHRRVNHLPQITAIHEAVSDSDHSRAKLYVFSGGLSFRNSLTLGRPGLPFADGVEPTAIEVPTTTLDTFCSSENVRPDVIKIDVEGAELMVLRGASCVLRQCRPALVLSVHPFWLPASQSSNQIFEFLSDHRYRIKDSHIVFHEGYEIGDYLLMYE